MNGATTTAVTQAANKLEPSQSLRNDNLPSNKTKIESEEQIKNNIRDLDVQRVFRNTRFFKDFLKD